MEPADTTGRASRLGHPPALAAVFAITVTGILSNMIFGLGEGIFLPTLQDVVAGAATPATRGATLATFIGAARAGQTVGPLAASGVAGATSAGATFVIGGLVSLGLVAFQTTIPFED